MKTELKKFSLNYFLKPIDLRFMHFGDEFLVQAGAVLDLNKMQIDFTQPNNELKFVYPRN